MRTSVEIKYIPTIVLRHRKENLKKCSLTGLEAREDMRFYQYPAKNLPDLASYMMLAIDAPVLTSEDSKYGVLLIDGTWRYAKKMETFVESHQTLPKRSLPNGWKTAYPRKQEDCPSPDQGLASIEALFAAFYILGRPTEGLLDNYYWKKQFLSNNGLSFSQ